jgi:DHA2 family multidrug resistance protein-like MFS transporter
MPAHPKATPRDWIGLAVLALPCLVYAMDLTILNLALPAISADLKPSTAQLLWIVDIYGFGVAGLLITMGTLGDLIGRRKLLLIGAASFSAASTLAAFSTDATMLIATRALLGVAGATLAPSSLSLIRNMFHDERQRQFAIGLWIASFSLGGAIGPLAGGVLLQYLPWGSVFLAAVPVMLLVLVLGPALLPEYRDPGTGRLDPVSVALSLSCVLTVIYGLKQIAERGPSWTPGLLVLGGLAIGVAFVRRQRRLDYPLLDLDLFRRPAFSASITAYGLSGLAMFGVYIFITQYLQLVLGLSPLQAGVATLPWALGFVLGSLLAPRWTRHRSPASVLVGGLLAAAAGFTLIALAGGRFALEALVAGMIVMSLGMAPVFTLGSEIILMAAPPERTGAASAISETASEFSGALGIALFGSLGMAIYRASLGTGMPRGIPPETADAALATLGAAVAAAGALPGPEGAALLHAARGAFGDALRLIALLGIVIVLAASALVARILRDGGGPPVPARQHV